MPLHAAFKCDRRDAVIATSLGDVGRSALVGVAMAVRREGDLDEAQANSLLQQRAWRRRAAASEPVNAFLNPASRPSCLFMLPPAPRWHPSCTGDPHR